MEQSIGLSNSPARRRPGDHIGRKAAWVLSLLVTACAGSTTLPMNFPSDIPIHAGAEVLEVDQMDGGVSVVLKSSDGKKSVARTYAESLTAAGWKISAQRDTPTGETMIFADKASARRSISVLLTPEGSGTRVALMETLR